MKTIFVTAALAAATALACPAAAVTFVVSPANQGPKLPVGFDKYIVNTNFDSGAPANLTGGSLRTGSNGYLYAAPYGDTTQYYAVGPEAGTPATLTASDFDLVSFYWGSIDYFNTVTFLGLGGAPIASFSGSQIDGTAMPTGLDSRTVTFSLSQAERAVVTGIRFSSSVNAFEMDNLAVGSAPEPAVWATTILGFGLVGGSLRRRKAAPKSVPLPA